MTPTQRSLKYLRSCGYTAEVTEHWNPFARVRNDLFGIVDILCVSEHGTEAVQTTSYSNVSARVTKILACKHLPSMVSAGWRITVHGWKKPTKKIRTWTLRTVEIAADGIMLPREE